MIADNIKDIKIEEFDYPLPDERIARHPLEQRDACRLLVSRNKEEIYDTIFNHLPDLLEEGTLLVCNDTRVINARIKFEKSTGSKIEIFLLEPISPADYAEMFQSRGECRWSCLVGNLKRWKDVPLEKKLTIDGREVTLTAIRHEARGGNSHEIEFRWDDADITFATIVDAAGYIPIPPYLKRESEASDSEDYQTIYAKYKGSVAAPTAGLHFTPGLMERLSEKNIDTAPVTLHVGAGTFQPVKSEKIGEHPMHTETFSVSRRSLEMLSRALRENRKVLAVGTTSVRTLESLPIIGMQIAEGRDCPEVTQWEAYERLSEDEISEPFESKKEKSADLIDKIIDFIDKNGMPSLICNTSIMIAPGFHWRIVDEMITNFHQPQSTLLLLVSSFLGKDSDGHERWRKLYEHALNGDYRFLSYGDASLFSR